MISINTNLSTLIAQSNHKQSSKILNQAVERMSTGYKINHAKDNAANYSIATNMSTKISAYQVAEDNVMQGLDMLNTASETLSEIETLATRYHTLAIQSRNGVYGQQSLNAINSESRALLREIIRLYTTAEHNGIKLFSNNETSAEAINDAPQTYSLRRSAVVKPEAKAEYGGFIENPKTYSDSEVENMVSITGLTSVTSGTEYKISSAEGLAQLATIVNSGQDTTGAIFVLADDIDLSEWCAANGDWTPIGNYFVDTTYKFKGTFDGNGHSISNLKIENSRNNYQGLFGATSSGAIIKNVALKNISVKGNANTGGLAGSASYSIINNNYVEGSVEGNSNNSGGFFGTCTFSEITNCYFTGEVKGKVKMTAGLTGNAVETSITSCFTDSDVIAVGSGQHTGGLVGQAYKNSPITNCFTKGSVKGAGLYTGGLVGEAFTSSPIDNCYSSAYVSSNSDYTGGLVGFVTSASPISNSYATGDVDSSGNYTGGLIGRSNNILENCHAEGDVVGNKYTGGLVGYVQSFSNCYATGNVKGTEFVGGLVGLLYKTSGTFNVAGCTSSGVINGEEKTGSFIGGIVNTSNGTSYGIINIQDCTVREQNVDLIGGCYKFESSTYTALPDYDMSSMLNGIKEIVIRELHSSSFDIALQVGLNSDKYSQISFGIGLSFDVTLESVALESDYALESITEILGHLELKQVELGVVQNRLTSALEEIQVQYENLVSSCSTIMDADISEVSAQYIQQQILQNAAATLISTANQTPAIALQLI